MTLSTGLRRASALIALALALAACCPSRQLRFDTPEAALDSWQSQLCHDEIEAEYTCLAHDLKLAMGGFPTYVGARNQLLDNHPFAAAYLRYGSLVERDHERVPLGPDRVRFEYSYDGQPFGLGFAREAWIVVSFDDERAELQRRLATVMPGLVGVSGPRQWLNLPDDLLSAEQREHVRALRVEYRWKIASVDGLLAEASPPSEEPQL